MSRTTPTSWKVQVKIFEKFGCKFVRQKGDHLIFDSPGAKRAVVIPKYDSVPVFIIKNNMKVVGMTFETYREILEEIG
jgi:predicted RNA binding protein YcfA (HicA-like mRNA interferase family)